ncbi:MFS transporter [Rhizocola hellebori]|uniref:MFS transporter n=1 Tax=Rhizocola hellebori TaxID=1392758 RepID=A0A8J3Q303_9ACTN|nr:MFS transporter [Rhizocola hellebori]GIH02539.1 MFS transporter [Rhizocola hellebori]
MTPVVDVLAEPSGKVAPRWIAFFSVAVAGTFVGWYGPLQILLARQAEAVSPHGKENLLALVAGVGAAFSMVANPLWGALSDRTTSRFGKRIPWIAAGGVLGAASLLLLGSASSVALLVAGWCLVQVVLNAPFAALSAAIPDQVPVAQRGTAGGYFGIAQIFGVMLGTGLAVAGVGLLGGTFGGYLVCAGFVLIAWVPYVVLRRDVVLAASERPALKLAAMVRGFWLSPRRYPDFAWAWLTRFLMNLGNSIVLLYLLFFLKDEVRVEDPDASVLILTVINALSLLVSVMVAGIWSDRVGKRRVFVFWAGLIMAAAAVLLAAWPTWTVAMVAAAVLGLGFGVYTSVDFALLTQVLPAAVDRGKDLGVLNIANALPQVLAPVIAAPIVTSLGGYSTLYSVSAIVGLVGAVFVYQIRSVR